MWAEHAACAPHPRAWWFPERYETGGYARAVAICATCPVRAECLEEALAYEIGRHDRFGMWGGLTPAERTREADRREAAGIPVPRRRARQAQCGTSSGYHRHHRRREPACQPCKDAHAEEHRRRDERKAIRSGRNPNQGFQPVELDTIAKHRHLYDDDEPAA